MPRLTLIFLASLLIAAAPATQPEIRRGVSTATTNPDDRQREMFDQLIRRIEPAGKGDPKRLDAYMDAFQREFVEDRRLFAVDLHATDKGDGRVEITGYSEFIEHAKSAERFLMQLGFTLIENQVRMLPDATVGKSLVGTIAFENGFVFDHTTLPRETVTECLRGEPVFLLSKTNDGYFLVHAQDGYVGYLPVENVQPGAPVPTESSAETKAKIERIIQFARNRLGVKYVWGGRDARGVDCSGLVQTAYQQIGIHLPRDADQQSQMGRLVATRACRESLRRGDLLFFLSRSGTVRHVAIYLGDERYIQAADAGVKISSFDPKDPAYDDKHDRQFCFAKRVIE